VSALNAEDPSAAAQFNASPVAQGYLRQFLASPPARRQQLAQQALAVPGAAQQVGLVAQLANTCNNY
jgi:hemophore-related protein